jgi:outer membrane protein TolC
VPARNDSRAARCIPGLISIAILGSTPVYAQTATVPPAKAPLVQSSADVQPIDLPTTLRLAGANNIDLALIREALVQAEAQNDAATLSFIPNLSGGLGYTKHNGAIQDVSGNVIDAYKQLHTTVGGFTSQVNLGDAIFQKLAARRLQSAAEYSVDAGRNITLFAAANAYLDLVSARADVKIAENAVGISSDYESQINRAVGIGLANKSDALRVSVQTQSYQVALRQARETSVAASAKLATILHLAPTTQFAPVDETVPQITLVPLETQMDSLVSEAFDKRPELKASAASIEAADWQKTQSIYGPLIPTIGAQALYGDISGGRTGLPSNSGGNQDYAVMFNWKVGPGGLFDFSRIDYAQSKLNQGKLNDAKLHDEIGRQVVQTVEGVHSAFDQLQLTKKNIELAEQSLQLSLGRKEFGVAAVLEVIQAQKDVVQARASYIRSMTAYAKGQYALAQAVGRISE